MLKRLCKLPARRSCFLFGARQTGKTSSSRACCRGAPGPWIDSGTRPRSASRATRTSSGPKRRPRSTREFGPSSASGRDNGEPDRREGLPARPYRGLSARGDPGRSRRPEPGRLRRVLGGCRVPQRRHPQRQQAHPRVPRIVVCLAPEDYELEGAKVLHFELFLSRSLALV